MKIKTHLKKLLMTCKMILISITLLAIINLSIAIQIPKPEKIIACLDNAVYLGSSKNLAKLVDISSGKTARLLCSFCMENYVMGPKKWYYKQRGSESFFKEINDKDSNNKISLLEDYSLEIKDFQVKESGIYICKTCMKSEDYIFTYILDETFDLHIQPISGTLSQWQNYNRRYITPLNEEFEKSAKNPFLKLRNTYSFTFRLFTSWGSWGPCQNCNNRIRVRNKLGKCTLHPVPNYNKKEFPNSNSVKLFDSYFMHDNYDISCRSLKFNETFQEISQLVSRIPEYKITEACSYIFTNNSGVNFEYKYKKTKQIAENGHITLICPESSPESKVEWFKDFNILNASFRNNMGRSEEEPHITIDSYNSLYILQATKNDKGVYSCTVDGKDIQLYDIEVVGKSELLNDEFIRYSIYLSFVLSLAMTCYCAAICVAWHRRSSFADPLNLNNKKI